MANMCGGLVVWVRIGLLTTASRAVFRITVSANLTLYSSPYSPQYSLPQCNRIRTFSSFYHTLRHSQPNGRSNC